jgi:tripartite-type tricarboxylate transporter receptor subunit TctC
MPRLSFLPTAVALACTLAASAALAQSPLCGGRPVTVVVPFAAGGGVDATARLVLPKLADALRQSMVIENVAGAAGTIGTQKVARAPADGCTLLFAVASPLNVAPLVAPAAVRYDTFKDFTPLATVAVGPFVLIGRTSLPAATAAELVKLARAQPGKLNFGTDGVGTSLHVTAELIKQRAGLDMVHVPYKSGPQVLTDVAGGQVDLAVLPLTLAQPFIREGKVRAYGVTSATRWPGLPDVPALAETAELKDVNVESWLGFLAPANLPAPMAAAVTRGIETVTADPEVGKKLTDIANKPLAIAGPKFGEYLARERKLVQDVVTRANIRAE